MPVRTSLRSACPINALVESLGDPWSLLILRDVVLRRRFRYSEFQRSDEGIATNILADRLKRLVRDGFLERRPDPGDRRSSLFLPTERTLDLIPLLLASATAFAQAPAAPAAPAPAAQAAPADMSKADKKASHKAAHADKKAAKKAHRKATRKAAKKADKTAAVGAAHTTRHAHVTHRKAQRSAHAAA